MKKIKRFFAGLLSSVMILTAMPAFAASTGSVASDKSIGSDTVQGASTSYEEVGVGSSKTNVYLTVDNSNIKVGVPTTIILNGSPNENGEYVAQYGVSVGGDISGGSILTVEPSDNEVALQQAGKDDITATITQSQTQFSSDDLKNNLVTQGTVSATALTAGSWNGQTSFNISLGTQILAGYTTLYEYDLSATENDDVKAYYMVPNEKTTPVEAETVDSITASASLLSSITSLFQPLTVYAAESNVIEKDGMQYEISDEDTLIITGEGEMKENVYSDLVDFQGIYEAVDEEFKTERYNGQNRIPDITYIEYIENTYYIRSAYNIDENGNKHYRTTIADINEYIDSIKSNYIISLPKTVVIRDGVTNISNRAFRSCHTLQNVELSSTVKDIGEYAFKSCSNLISVNIKEGLINIADHSFDYCSNLASINIPNTVTNIGEYAFYSCASLTNINIPNNLEYIGKNAFRECVKWAGEITIPNTVTNIGEGAFSSCYQITNINIPDSVTSIGNFAFYHCTGLTSVTIPGSVTSIGNYAFENLASNSTIYCETQAVADLLSGKYTTSNTTLVIAPEKFS